MDYDTEELANALISRKGYIVVYSIIELAIGTIIPLTLDGISVPAAKIIGTATAAEYNEQFNVQYGNFGSSYLYYKVVMD